MIPIIRITIYLVDRKRHLKADRESIMKMRITALISAMIILLVLSACGPKIPTPTETADTFLTAIKEQDDEKLATVYSEGIMNLLNKTALTEEIENMDEDSDFAKVFEENMLPKILDFDYELSNEQIEEDKATVDVKFTTYSFGDAFTSFFSDFISQAMVMAFSDASEEEMDALAVTLLKGKVAELSEKNYEKTVTLSLSMKDGKWMVDEIEAEGEFIDGLSGGLVTAFAGMEETVEALEVE